MADITIRVRQRGVAAATRGLDQLAGSGDRVTRAMRGIIRNQRGIVGAFAAIAAAITAATVRSARLVTELDNLSRLAGMSRGDFAGLGFAAQQFGSNAEQVADQLKDVAERVGEFLTLSEGGFNDFVDVVGLSEREAGLFAARIEQLSGSDALIALVAELEKAGASAGQMSFALEGLGSDLTKLLPLLINNGAELNRLQSRLNAVTSPLTDEDVSVFRSLNETLDLLSAGFANLVQRGTAQVAGTLNDIGKSAEDALDYLSPTPLEKQIRETRKEAELLESQIKNLAAFAKENPELLTGDTTALDAQLKAKRAELKQLEEQLKAARTPAPTGPDDEKSLQDRQTRALRRVEELRQREAAAAQATAQAKIDADQRARAAQIETLKRRLMTIEEVYEKEIELIDNAGLAEAERAVLVDRLQARLQAQLTEDIIKRERARLDDYTESFTENQQLLIEGIQAAGDAMSASLSQGFIDLTKGAASVEDVILGTLDSIAQSIIRSIIDFSVQRLVIDKIMSITGLVTEALNPQEFLAQAKNLANVTLISQQQSALAAQAAYASTAAIPVVGPGLAPAAATAAFAAAEALGAGAITAAAASRQQGGDVAARRAYIVGERGRELFIPAQSGRIMPNNQIPPRGAPAAAPAPAPTVNVNIQAVDAQGVDRILVQRRSLIYGLVRDAMANEGRRL